MSCGGAGAGTVYLLLDTCGLPYLWQQQPAEGKSSLVLRNVLLHILCAFPSGENPQQIKQNNGQRYAHFGM